MQPLLFFSFNNFRAFPGVVGVHSYGNDVIIRNGEKKMEISTKKVKLARYGKGFFIFC